MPGPNLFTGKSAGTVSITGTTSTQPLALARTAAETAVRVKNLDTAITQFITFGTSSAITAAVATAIPIGPGELTGFSIGPDITHVAVITSGSNATSPIYFTPGNGI